MPSRGSCSPSRIVCHTGELALGLELLVQTRREDSRRIRAVLRQHGARVGSTTTPLLDALVGYWKAVSGLAQRQEHGGQKEGRDLVWEDGRRVVFQTAVVMFETDRALTLTRPAG